MKLKLTAALVSAPILTFTALTSCDGGSGEGELTLEERDLLTAESLAPEEVSNGDVILWVTNTGNEPFVDLVSLGPLGSTTFGDAVYAYAKTGEFTFSITRTSLIPSTQRLALSLDNTLGGRTTDAQLGSRLRTLLHRDAPIFDETELREIISILNPSGANLTISSSGELVIVDNSRWTHLVTSNRGEQFNGAMGGTYQLDTNSVIIEFRNPTAEEQALYRFLDADDWIPAVSTNFIPTDRTEQGTWELELVNRVD